MLKRKKKMKKKVKDNKDKEFGSVVYWKLQ